MYEYTRVKISQRQVLTAYQKIDDLVGQTFQILCIFPLSRPHLLLPRIIPMFVSHIKMYLLVFCDRNQYCWAIGYEKRKDIKLELIINNLLIIVIYLRKFILLSSKWYQNDHPKSTGTGAATLRPNGIWQIPFVMMSFCGQTTWLLVLIFNMEQ